MAKCALCSKKTRVGRNVSHSGVHTRRLFRPNLHKYQGKYYCTKCLRKYKKEQEAQKSPPKKAPVQQPA